MDIKIVNVPEKHWYSAISVGKTHLENYPEGKIGFRAGVVYTTLVVCPTGLEPLSLYTYKTKTQLVVRGA